VRETSIRVGWVDRKRAGLWINWMNAICGVVLAVLLNVRDDEWRAEQWRRDATWWLFAEKGAFCIVDIYYTCLRLTGVDRLWFSMHHCCELLLLVMVDAYGMQHLDHAAVRQLGAGFCLLYLDSLVYYPSKLTQSETLRYLHRTVCVINRLVIFPVYMLRGRCVHGLLPNATASRLLCFIQFSFTFVLNPTLVYNVLP
jgi:hypothetical protein